MKVLVALSGGVDSSVAASLLAREGHDLVGVTMKNWCYGQDEGERRSCCSLESIRSARRVARRLGFSHYVVDFEAPFTRHVIQPFVRDYVEGRTPNPCVSCNAKVRFPGLANRAAALGCERFATGHYARIDRETSPPRIRRAADRTKDQSYVLWGVPDEALERFLLPLGELDKSEVREIAGREGLESAERPDSQEICFVPDGDYGAFLERTAGEAGELPESLEAGEIVTTGGEIVGTHRGVARYTIGQRKGLGIALGEPAYVVAVDPASNRVVVGSERDLLSREADLRDVAWPREKETEQEIEVSVQLRSRHPGAPARVRRLGSRAARVVFHEAQRAITPGQSAVFFEGDRLIGGGVVADRTVWANEG